MMRVKEVKVFEAFSVGELERYINNYLSENRNLSIMDIKYDVYEEDISEEFSDLEEGEKVKENRFSALILIGEEL